MKDRILKILQNSDDYVSGQKLCDELGISRTAIWKNINSLKNKGYEIEGVNNKGYRLVSVPDNMDESGVVPYLQTKVYAREYVYYDEIDSTNVRAKIAGEQGVQHGTLFVADRQTAGRGRRGRGWDSPKGNSIFMTYLLRPEVDISVVSRLTIVAAMAVTKALRNIDGVDAKIKWPNDVVADGKKLCGILTEMSSEGMDINYVVVGIGINVNMTSFPDEIKETATSLKLITGRDICRAKIIADISNYFEKYCEAFLRTGDLTNLIDEYNSLLVNKDKQVYVIEGDTKTEYTALGIGEDGTLIVKDETGEIRNILSGEVSVRGIYGYV